MQGELIKVVQLPVIEQQLKALKADVDTAVSEALSLACTPETVQAVKAKRTELGKQFQVLEAQRKDVKKAVMGPYEAFEAVYRECVGDAFKDADRALKSKIDSVENAIKENCENTLREYFSELTAVHHVEWLPYESAGIRVGMTDAKAKIPKKLMQQLDAYVERVESDVGTLSGMEHADELLVEYKSVLDMGAAITAVTARHAALEAERVQREQTAVVKEREQEAVARVEAVAPPVMAPERKAEPAAESVEPVLASTFTVHGTKAQLIGLIRYMKDNSIRFENAN